LYPVGACYTSGMKKLNMHTTDLTEENIEKIAALFPQVVTEKEGEDGATTRSVDFDLLRQLLSDSLVEGADERYRLDWPGKKRSLLKANTPITKTLRPVREESVDFDTTQNLFIEGDNFEALKILQESYLGKVKMIYIDPPYNTGKDFVYSDKHTMDEEDYTELTGAEDEEGNKMFKENTRTNPRFHSDWLSMMYVRLIIARDLLRDDGVIFISIDDNEVHNLRKVCDEIFGENHFLSQMIVQSNPGGRDYGGVARTHDYVLVYQKTENSLIKGIPVEAESLPKQDEIGYFEPRELRNRNIKFNSENRPNLHYPFYVDPGTILDNEYLKVSLVRQPDFIEVWPKESQGVRTVWRWGKDKAKKGIENNDVVAKYKRDGELMIVEKFRKTEKMIRSILTGSEFTTEDGSETAKELFEGASFFDYAKPVDLIRSLIQISTDQDDFVLDFFSGSATSAHAVMQQNAEDGGNRKYIMVQLPEETPEDSEARKAGYENIAQLGRERIRRAAAKIQSRLRR
jgi:adenine-specific DNA-methyltransferase